MAFQGPITLLFIALTLAGCAPDSGRGPDGTVDAASQVSVLVRVSEQKLYLIRDGKVIREYPVSTSKFGIGNKAGSFKTPLGRHRVAEKIGEGAPLYTIFKERVNTRKLAVIERTLKGAPYDDVTTRILWLEGLEPGINRGPGIDSKQRFIYIHGTPSEGLIGRPASNGCVRMYNKDVIELFDLVPAGAPVLIASYGRPDLLNTLFPTYRPPPTMTQGDPMNNAKCSTSAKSCPGKALIKIAVGAVTVWGIGMIWYGDLAFGPEWMRLTGITPEAVAEIMKTEAGKIMGLSIANCLVVSFALHALFCMANAFSFCRRFAVALFSLALAATVVFSGVIWEGKSTTLFLIALGYYAASFISVAGMTSLISRFCVKSTPFDDKSGQPGSHQGKDGKGGKDDCCKH